MSRKPTDTVGGPFQGGVLAPDGSVTPLPAERIDRFLTIRQPPRSYLGECEHKSSTLDMQLRRVVCSKCGEMLDPLEVLREFSHWVREKQALWERMAAWDAERRAESSAEFRATVERRDAQKQIAWCVEASATVSFGRNGVTVRLPGGREQRGKSLAEAINRVCRTPQPEGA